MKATHQPPTLDHQPGTSPADLLRGAALYLTRHGWTQGQFFDLLADTDGPFMPACASGAIITAASGRCLPNGLLTDDDQHPDALAAMRAMRVFADWIDGGYVPVDGFPASSIDVIGDWNDHDGRTLTEVIEALTDAADDWDRTHHTGGAR
jgi:hypothetical protein